MEKAWRLRQAQWRRESVELWALVDCLFGGAPEASLINSSVSIVHIIAVLCLPRTACCSPLLTALLHHLCRPRSPPYSMDKSTSSLKPTSQLHNYRAQQAPIGSDSLVSAPHGNSKPGAGNTRAGISTLATSEPEDSKLSRSLDVNDALRYLDVVKERFPDQPDVYDQFLDIMAKFRGQK